MRTDTFETTATTCIAGLFDAQFQTIREKSKGIEQRALADPIFANDRRHWSQWLDGLRVPQFPEGNVVQHPVILDSYSFNSCHRGVSSRYLGATGRTESSMRISTRWPEKKILPRLLTAAPAPNRLPSWPPWMDLVTAEGDAFQPVWRAAGIVGLAECEIVRRLTLEHQVCAKL